MNSCIGWWLICTVVIHAVSAWADEPVPVITEPVVTIQVGEGLGVIGYSADGKQLAVIHDGKNIGIHDAATGKQLQRIATTTGLDSVQFAPDGVHVVTSGRQGIRFYQLSNGKETRAVGTEMHRSCSFSPLGERLAAGQVCLGATIWNTNTWKVVCQLHTTKLGSQSRVSFHPDGRRLATFGSTLPAIEVWDVTMAEVVQVFETKHSRIDIAVFSGDGSKLVATTRVNVHVWDLKTRKKLFALPPQNPLIATFSLNSRLATASRDNTISIRNAGDGRELLRLKGHTDTVINVAFSPDCEHLASTSRDGTVRIWKLTLD